MRRLFDLGREKCAPSCTWTEREYAQLLAHQLDAPLVFAGLPDVPGDGQNAGNEAGAGSGIHSIRQLLAHAAPPLGLLQSAKQYVKAGTRSDDHPLPRPVALVLYYSLVVVTWQRHGSGLTGLSEAELSKGVQWALAQAWLDEHLRRLLQSWH